MPTRSNSAYVAGQLAAARCQQWGQFLWAVTKKEIKARYKHTALGFLWTIVNPLMQMVVIGTVFQFFVPVKVDNYFVFLFAGLLIWDFFAATLSRTTPLYVYERFLLQKAQFPREVLFLADVLANVFHLVIATGLFWLISVIWLGQPVGWSLLWLPVALGWAMALVTGLAAVTSSLNVQFRDVDFVVRAMLPLWFYATPVLYTLDILPSQWQWVFYWNPMVGVVELFRASLLGLPVTNALLLGANAVITGMIVLVGWWVFRRLSPHFCDWL